MDEVTKNVSLNDVQFAIKQVNEFDLSKIDYAKVKEFLFKDQKRACIIGFLALYLMIGWGNDFVCNLIGFLYPAYASVKAIESVHTDDDTKWLMYWCVYATFGILEFFTDQLLFWIPFYQLSKCLFLIWAMIPGKNGGTHIIYTNILRPFFLKHQDNIDKTIGKAKEEFGKVIRENLGDKKE